MLKIDYLQNSFDFEVEVNRSTPQRPVPVPDISSLSPIFKCSPVEDAHSKRLWCRGYGQGIPFMF